MNNKWIMTSVWSLMVVLSFSACLKKDSHANGTNWAGSDINHSNKPNVNFDAVFIEIVHLEKISVFEVVAVFSVGNNHSLKTLSRLTFRLQNHAELGNFMLPARQYGTVPSYGGYRPFFPVTAGDGIDVAVVLDTKTSKEAALANHLSHVLTLQSQGVNVGSQLAIHVSLDDLTFE